MKHKHILTGEESASDKGRAKHVLYCTNCGKRQWASFPTGHCQSCAKKEENWAMVVDNMNLEGRGTVESLLEERDGRKAPQWQQDILAKAKQ